MNLKNKVIIITGASDGIGREIALRIAKEGTKLALIGRDEKRLGEASKEAKKLGAVEVKVYACNLCKTEILEETVRSVVNDFGEIDILINNAGIWQKMMPVEDISREVVDEIIQINLIAPIHMTRLVLPILKKQKEAAVINISSKSGVVPQEGQSVYSASKYGIRGFTEVLKADLKGSNVRVAGIYQSGTNTQMFAKTGEDVPSEKFTHPADLADVVAYMLSRPEKIWLDEVRVDR